MRYNRSGPQGHGAPIFWYVYGRTQKELLAKLHQSIETYQDVALTEDSRRTLGEWLGEYKTGTLRPSTVHGYRQYARLYTKPILGDKVLYGHPSDVHKTETGGAYP